MENVKYYSGEGKYRICLEISSTDGNGICAFLKGGEKPHMGGTVVASPRMKSSAEDEEDRTADIWISSVPGHKDVEAALPVAKYLAVVLNEPVSVSAGIHIEYADGEELRLLCDNCRLAAEQFVKEYQSI
jgi:hypothetical protein